jgi:hypothetical protein
VLSWFSPANPGTYLSLGQLRSRYPQFEGKRTAAKPDANDLANQLAVKMTEIKKDILDRRTRMVRSIRRFSQSTEEISKVYEAEKQRVAERLADLKVPGGSGKAGRTTFDVYTGEMSSDNAKSNAGDGVFVAQDELIVWETENADRAERDWKREQTRFLEETAAEENKIDKMVADYLALKKAGAAVTRARDNKQMNGDDALVRTGMQTLDAYR